MNPYPAVQRFENSNGDVRFQPVVMDGDKIIKMAQRSGGSWTWVNFTLAPFLIPSRRRAMDLAKSAVATMTREDYRPVGKPETDPS